MTTVVGTPVEARVRRGLGWGVTSNIVLRLGNVLVSILMARLIAPEQFGVFAVAMTVWSILGTLAEFGLGADLVRAEDIERRAPTVATIGLATGGVLAASMVVAAGPLAASFNSPESVGVIRLMAISIAVFGVTIVPAARLQREFRQGTLFVVNGAGMLASAAVMTVLATHGVGPASLAWGQVTAQVTIAVGLFLLTRTRPHFGLDRVIALESLRFCLPLAMANMLSWVLLSVDTLVVARLLSPVELGLYVLAFNVSSWPMSAVGQGLRVVALPAFSRVTSTEDRNRALIRCVGPVVAVAALMALLLGTLATPLVTFLYGERWHEAAGALAGLAIFGGLRVMLDLVATFLIAVGTTTAVLVVQVVWLAAMVPVMVVGVSRFGLDGAGWSHVVVGCAVVLPCYLICLRRVGVDVLGFLREWLVPLGSAVPAVAVCFWIGGRDAAPIILLVAGTTAALLLYALPLAPWWLRRINLLRHPPLEEELEEMTR